MSDQVYFEDVVEGQEIPLLEKKVNVLNLVMYHGIIWVYDRIHFDHIYATERRGLPGVVAPGNIAVDYYGHLLNDWIGEKGELRKISTQYRNFMVAGDTLYCGGRVINKYIKDGKGYVELELWINNQKGANCAPGKGVVELPIRHTQ